MSHPEQIAFFSAVVERNLSLTSDASVLEIGSYDVNGSMRDLFSGAGRYVGVDLAPGPGVDLVAYGHEVAGEDGSYDIAVSGECFEHDPHFRDTLSNMTRLTRPGGIVAFSCAAHGRPEHGTKRSDVADSPGTQSAGLDYYRNLGPEDFDPVQLDDAFSAWRFWSMPTTFDLYFMGARSGEPSEAQFPQDQQITRIANMMSPAHRAIRIPLRVAARLVRNEDRYQRLVLPYWLALLRASGGRRRSPRSVVEPGSR